MVYDDLEERSQSDNYFIPLKIKIDELSFFIDDNEYRKVVYVDEILDLLKNFTESFNSGDFVYLDIFKLP